MLHRVFNGTMTVFYVMAIFNPSQNALEHLTTNASCWQVVLKCEFIIPVSQPTFPKLNVGILGLALMDQQGGQGKVKTKTIFGQSFEVSQGF